VDCPKLNEFQRQLRRRVGDELANMSSLLRVSREDEIGKAESVMRARAVRVVLTIAEALRWF
jgi:hypothetical protein